MKKETKEKWKTAFYFILSFGVYGVFKTMNYQTSEEYAALILSIILCLASAVFFTWDWLKNRK